MRTVESGAYTFQTPALYEVDLRGGQATLSNDNDRVLMSMVSGPNPDGDSNEVLLKRFLANVAQDMREFEAESTLPARIGGREALQTAVRGVWNGRQVRGRVVVATPAPERMFIAFGIADSDAAGDSWQVRGSAVFDAVLGSVTFIAGGAGGTCAIALDKEYGYTPERPVMVGGDIFAGPARERAYLDTLRGPGGERLTYARRGTAPGTGGPLDRYEVTVAGEAAPRVLYLDMYNYEELKAPTGFTCAGAFPIGRP